MINWPDLSPALIDEVIKIQVFQRNGAGSDTLKEGSQETYVGKLEGYYKSKNGCAFRLKGMSMVHVVYLRQVIEFYVQETDV